MKIPQKSYNIYPKTKKNIKHLLNFYFDEFEPDRNGSVEYLISKTSLSLNQTEFIVKKLYENFLFVKSLFNKQNQLKLFLYYAIEATTIPEESWKGSDNSKKILSLIKKRFEKVENLDEDENCNITPNIIENENENEVIRIPLFDLQKKFHINFSNLGTNFYIHSGNEEEFRTNIWEYRLDDSLRFYSHHSREYISLTISLLKEILRNNQPNKEIELVIDKKQTFFYYKEYNIIGFNNINQIYRPEEEGNFDYCKDETNEEWIRNNFDDDDINTVLGNLD